MGSALGAGSTFRVFFPAIQAEVPKTATDSSSPTLDVSVGVILVVDDEAIVRRLVKAALEHRGYQVLLAENGLEAGDIFQQRAAEIVGVVLDMAMPVMDGAEVLRYIREIRPHVPLLRPAGTVN